MATQTDVLADVWADIEDELSGNISVPQGVERRGRARTRFVTDTEQRLALWNGTDVPDDGELRPVRLINISGSGTAFWSNERMPSRQQLLLSIEIEGHRRLLAEEVVRCMGVVTDDGGFAYQIGCRHKAIVLR